MNKAILGIALLTSSLSVFAEGLTLHSSDIQQGKSLQQSQVYQGFGCNGGNTSPQLSWVNAPKGTKSFAITAYDPNAPTGSGWWHWTVVNIPANIHTLAANAGAKDGKNLPLGAVQGRNDFGYAGFGGACPPPGDKPHPYRFTVWALKTDKLPIDSQSSGALVGFMLNANALAHAEITPHYGR
ncbi:kinase inhibitor [Hafnia paralvei]|uniref:kinase inhibitor n=1 Tax=Hafnia paralvei TaxID=546367 RepID=UPI001CCB9664|nr:kinase inhibitor [Hafnia paralvei]UBM42412.1 kinase inhibitor [Hafnia paralvei]